jgi:5-methyltetrahydrofolate--homocysteine methyltransferase
VLESYEELREEHYASLQERKYRTLQDARSRAMALDWAARPPVPLASGGLAPGSTKVFDSVSVTDLLEYIDWGPFFQTWELRGRYPNRGYPKIFNDATVGAQARQLFEEAQTMLKEVVAKGTLTVTGIAGIYAANSSGDDVLLYKGEGGEEAARLCFLRQQGEKELPEERHMCLSDFIAPPQCGRDYLGAFAVAVMGCEEAAAAYEAANDDYSKIMIQSLADRLAEAMAEYVHREMRVSLWGYAPQEQLSVQDMLKVRYQGIRPAPGYPSQPDHTEKRTLWDLMQVTEATGIQLTESLAMLPASSVSAVVFAHPDAAYFAVGNVCQDQVVDYAARKGMSVEEVERWLAPILGYERQ